MIRFARGIVRQVLSERPGAQEIEVLADGLGRQVINYIDLMGRVESGEEVVLNTTAVELDLGTGGYDFVVWRSGASSQGDSMPHEEALVKMRYSPFQKAFRAGELELPEDANIEGVPVVACELHSQAAAVAAGALSKRTAWVINDSAALPACISRLMPQLRSLGWVCGTVTSGQAFGGDYEAASLHSALLIAKHLLGAEVVIVSPGPGSAGTGHKWGFSGLSQVEALHAAHALGGRPIACIRASEADQRPRHQGVSHHSRTILQQAVFVQCAIAAPEGKAAMLAEFDRHEIAEVEIEPALQLLRKSLPNLASMGRTVDQDRLFFDFALAAGVLAQKAAF
ncbi:MAG: DUF3866 family protein [Armatimonadetes bacterium]|nr:DUF3866 family protein [Armatimonadota bacterium]